MNDPSDVARQPMPHIRRRAFDVFISHVRQDGDIALELANALESRDFTVWHKMKLRAGEPLQTIEHTLRSSGVIIVLLSATSLSSPIVAREIEMALGSFPRSAIIPVVVGEVDVNMVSPKLATLQWLHLRDSLRVETLVEQLLSTLDAITGGRVNDAGTVRIHGELPTRTPLVGVDDYLHRLRSQQTGITFILGSGGAGKTLLAREYAFHMRNDMDFLWWLGASLAPVAELRQQLQQVEDESIPGEHGLVIVDELDALEDVRGLLLELERLSRRHRVVITSRHIPDLAFERDQDLTVLTLDPLSHADVAHYFNIFAPQLSSNERAKAVQIADLTGSSPLALRLIAQVLQTHSIETLVAASSAEGGVIKASVQLLLGGLSENERHRLDVLSYCSGFLSLVRSNKRWILAGDDALFTLLIEWGICTSEADGTVEFRQPILDFLRAQATRGAFKDALDYLALRLPDPNDPNAQSYLSSITELTDLAELNWDFDTAGYLAELLIWQAYLWLASGVPGRAEMLCSKALEKAKESGQVLLRIRALNLQSALAFDRGQIDEANAIELRTADLAAIELGPEHPIAISALANLATTRRAQGSLAEAITLLRNALALGQRLLPDDHPDLTTARINLAVCLRDAGLAMEALMVLDQVGRNATDERVCLQAHQIQAAVLMDVGRSGEAAELLTEALKRAARLGLSETTDAFTARTNLAIIYARIGNLSEALALQREVVEQLDVISGPDHLSTLAARNNYAGLLARAGMSDSALQLWSEVATSRTRLLGAEHPDTLQSWLRVADASSKRGDSFGALKLYSDLLARVVRVFGPDHLTAYTIREKSAHLLSRTGDAEGARLTFRELLADLERVLPPDHPAVRRVAANVAEDGKSRRL